MSNPRPNYAQPIATFLRQVGVASALEVIDCARSDYRDALTRSDELAALRRLAEAKALVASLGV